MGEKHPPQVNFQPSTEPRFLPANGYLQAQPPKTRSLGARLDSLFPAVQREFRLKFVMDRYKAYLNREEQDAKVPADLPHSNGGLRW
jgi:hypothetical protein